jgi:preprotein translocase subunit SecE
VGYKAVTVRMQQVVVVVVVVVVALVLMLVDQGCTTALL